MNNVDAISREKFVKLKLLLAAISRDKIAKVKTHKK